jgi:hypothetical protein
VLLAIPFLTLPSLAGCAKAAPAAAAVSCSLGKGREAAALGVLQQSALASIH